MKLNSADARYWYYLGLTQWELGKPDEARAAFKNGSDLEGRTVLSVERQHISVLGRGQDTERPPGFD